MEKKKIIRITTVPISLEKLLEGQLSFMSQFFEIIAISSDKNNLQKFGLDNNIKVKYIELTRKITPFKDLIALISMILYFKNEKPLIVHSHTPKAGLISMLAAKFTRVPIRIHTVAGLPLLETNGLKRKILNFIEKITYFAANRVYPNSEGLRQIILKEKFCDSSKLKVLANGSTNGINTEIFNPELFNSEFKIDFKNQNMIDNEDFVFIFVGRLVGDKGINELIEAFTELQKINKKTKLLLVGAFESELDPLSNSTLNLINSNPNIISVGYQDDVRRYFAISDVLVFPSYREGFPNVVLQAGAMGLPSIVSNINGCNEIIKHEVNGLIIPVKDSIAIYNAMLKILDDIVLFDKMKSIARSIIVNNYQQKVVWEAILQEYNKLLK